MGKAGQPRDPAAWEAKRERALQLLARGYPQVVVARNVCASTSWVQRVAEEQRATKQSIGRSR